jgi:hypothetical protein
MALGIRIPTKLVTKKYQKPLTDYKPVNFKSPIFCPFQIGWITDRSLISVVEKGRQIGFSWTVGFFAVLEAAQNKYDTTINSYNLLAAKEVIRDCAKWARFFNLAAKLYEEIEVINEENINIFELKFTNGRIITAVAGNSVNFRGKRGNIIIDEAAYRDEPLEDILAASKACIIHGGVIRIASTHAGIDSEFNALCDSIKSGEEKFNLHRVTFKQAIDDGMYQRMCIKQGITYTLEVEQEFIQRIYDMYGVRASEELDAIPADYSEAGLFFQKVYFESVDDTVEPWNYQYYRYHDLACTPADKKDDNSFYSAGVLIALNTVTNKMTIKDWYAEQLNPNDADKKLIEIGKLDGENVTQILEIEPGSSSKRWFEITKEQMEKNGIYNVDGYQPHINKISRLIPAANMALNGSLVIDKALGTGTDLHKLIRRVSSKPTPLVSDLCDCISGIVDYVTNGKSYLY